MAGAAKREVGITMVLARDWDGQSFASAASLEAAHRTGDRVGFSMRRHSAAVAIWAS